MLHVNENPCRSRNLLNLTILLSHHGTTHKTFYARRKTFETNYRLAFCKEELLSECVMMTKVAFDNTKLFRLYLKYL